MKIGNTDKKYGSVSLFIHWISLISVLGLFFLGIWMVDLEYYHSWYRTAPELHISIGIFLFSLTLLRIIWLRLSPKPASLNTGWTLTFEKIGHRSLYAILLLLMFSGYLIFTADGRSISFFQLFDIPSTITSIPDQEDLAGSVHEILAWTLIVLVSLHALVALWHHFIVKDRTLKRMLGQ